MFEYNILGTDRTEADRNFAEAGHLVSVIQAAYRSAAQGGTLVTPSVRLDGTESLEGPDGLDVAYGRPGASMEA